MNEFDEYIKMGEPDKKEKSIIWQTAIGLQQVDGLKPSAYLIETAKQNIEGDITIDEVKKRIDAYYKTQSVEQADSDDRTEEADKVSARIAEILSEKTFSFSPTEFVNIHRRLFSGIYKFAGKMRDYNIAKAEWVLNGETVLYASALNLMETLEYDFQQEKAFNYKGLSKTQIIEHIAHFVAYLWQIHIFGEGNTRTTAVFLIKYLHKLGFKNTNNDLFAAHSWYFRNALVRANYEDISQGVHKTDKYLIRFLSNLLLGENNELKNRYLHIHYVAPQNDTKNVGEMSEKCRRNVGEMSERQNKILEIIATNKTVSAQQLSELLNTTARTIEREIKKMREMNIIKRIGGDRGGHWQINKTQNNE
ncbi:MAG: Fic family protein [Prevotellaceae bacterium]|nr:Fic family protein [Prevotellaceae bacterium]